MSITVKFEDITQKEQRTFFMAIESGEIVCPEPILWNDFWKKFVKPIVGRDLMPLILSSWWEATDQEKNERFNLQIIAIDKNHNRQEIFDFFSNYKQRNEWRVSEK